MLSCIIRSRNILLAYVLRPDVSIPLISSIVCAADCPYSIEQGSVSNELIVRAGYDYPLLNEDNTKLYFAIEEAVRNTNYATSIKPFQRSKNGRGALLSLKHQYYNKDNTKVYFTIKEVVHNTNYATSIKPFQRSKNGRGAPLSLKYQYCGKDK